MTLLGKYFSWNGLLIILENLLELLLVESCFRADVHQFVHELFVKVGFVFVTGRELTVLKLLHQRLDFVRVALIFELFKKLCLLILVI